jgi:hypothetical protein
VNAVIVDRSGEVHRVVRMGLLDGPACGAKGRQRQVTAAQILTFSLRRCVHCMPGGWPSDWALTDEHGRGGAR